MGNVVSIAKEYSWSMGHALWKHDGKCYHPHGHNYRMEVEVSGAVDETSGMVLDFSELDDWADPLIADVFDHKFLMNDADERHRGGDLHPDFDVTTCPFEPTAERLALMFWGIWEESREAAQTFVGVTLERITIYETDKGSATVRRT